MIRFHSTVCFRCLLLPNLIGTGEFSGLYDLSCHVDSVSPCFGVSGLTTFPVALRLTLLTGIGSRQVMNLGLAFFRLASRPCVYIVRFTMLSEGGILPLGVRSMDLLRLFDVNCGELVFKGASITLPKLIPCGNASLVRTPGFSFYTVEALLSYLEFQGFSSLVWPCAVVLDT